MDEASYDDQEDLHLELLAIELHANVLLNRAHFLFSTSRCDVEQAEEIRDRGRVALDQAEDLCMSHKHPVSELLKAKCWYVRGFLADLTRDCSSAWHCFQEALKLNEDYRNLKTIQAYLHRHEDEEEMSDMWSDADSDAAMPSPSIQALKHISPLAEADANSSKHSRSTDSDRNSALFAILMNDVKRTGFVTESSRPSTPQEGSCSSEKGLVDQVMDQLKTASPRRRPSLEMHEGSTPISTEPLQTSSRQLLTLEDYQRRADTEHRERLLLERQYVTAEPRPKASPFSPTRAHAQEETLLSDTPSISRLLDTTTRLPNPSPSIRDKRSSSNDLILNTQSLRRASTSSMRSLPNSPTTSSPLRQAFSPSEAGNATGSIRVDGGK